MAFDESGDKVLQGLLVEHKLNRGFLLSLCCIALPERREKVKDCGTTSGHVGQDRPDPDERRTRGPRSLNGIGIPVRCSGIPRVGPTRFTSAMAVQSDLLLSGHGCRRDAFKIDRECSVRLTRHHVRLVRG